MQCNSVLFNQYMAQAKNSIQDSQMISPIHALIDPRFSTILMRGMNSRARASQQQMNPTNWVHSPSAVTINSNAWLPTEVSNKQSEDVPKKSCLSPMWKNRLHGLLVGLAVAGISIGIILGILLTRPSTSSTTHTTTAACSSLQWNQVSVTVAGNGTYDNAPELLAYPRDIYVDSNNALYVADQNNHRVQKWLPNAVSGITVAGVTGVSGTNGSLLIYPITVYVDAQQNLYVGDNYAISKWPSGASIGTVVPGSNYSIIGSVYAIFIDNNGNLYVSSSSNCVIRMWTPTATASIIVAGGSACGYSSSQLYSANGFTVNSLTNTIYTANGYAHTVVAWTIGATSGIIMAGRNATYGSADFLLYNPRDVKLDHDGNLYIADYSNNRILLLCQNPPSTNGRLIAGYKISSLYSMALDADLNLYVSLPYRVEKYARIV